MDRTLSPLAWRALALATLLPVAFGAAQAVAALDTPSGPPDAKGKTAPATKRSSTARLGKSSPQRVTSIDVTVLDPAEQPVEKAFLLAYPTTGAYGLYGLKADKVRTVVTGKDGKAKLESLPAGPWNVSVYARGFYARPAQNVTSGPLVFRLVKGGVITGVVRDGAEGRPIAGARVAVDTGGFIPGDWEGAAMRNEAASDARGTFRIEGIGPSPVSLSARAAGYGTVVRQNVRAGARAELILFPGPTLTGTVRNEQGLPVKGATVRAGTDAWGPQPPSVRSNEQGVFAIAGLKSGEYTVVAREGSRAPAIAMVVVEPESEPTLALVLTEGGSVTGRIVDAAGRPLAGSVRVEAFEGRGLPAFASELMTATAQADGVFTVGPLPPAALGIRVSAPRHTSLRIEATLPSSGHAADIGDVALEDGLAIRGRVRDKEDSGLAGVSVRATQSTGERAEAETESEVDGTFVVGGLAAGRYQVSGSLSGYATARASGEAGGVPVMLVMEPGGQITGRVVDEKGQPVEDAQIRAEPADTPDRQRWERGAWGRSDEGEGGFSLRDLAPGTYVVTALASGRGEASAGGVRVTAGGVANVGTLALRGGGIILGVVVDADGRGVPGATVGAERDSNMRTGQLSTQSDTSGAFEIRGAPAGKLAVSATHPAFAPSASVVVEVEPEKEPATARLVLLQGGRIEGRALRRDGSPFVGGRVTVFGKGPGSPSFPEPAAVASDGAFAREHVPPGPASVNLMAFTPSHPQVSGSPVLSILTGIDSRDVDVRDGETVAVDFSLRDVVVAGRVTRGGQPVPGVRVSVMNPAGWNATMSFVGPGGRASDVAAGPPFLSSVTREDGAFELLVFVPGPAHVRLDAEGQGLPGREVEIPDVERYELDLELAETTVSGIVVARETGEPLTEGGVSLRSPDAEESWKGGARIGSDGRFVVGIDPGEYVLRAQAPGRRAASMPVTVEAAGLADVRVELESGLGLRGHVVDEAGRPVPSVQVDAAGPEGQYASDTHTIADGTFRLDGLDDKRHTLTAGSALAGYAIRAGVQPGDEPITLALHPGGTIALRVVDGAGGPVEGAYLRITTVAGSKVASLPRHYQPTNADGTTEISSPTGVVELEVGKEALKGHGRVSVSRDETVALTVTLERPAEAR